MTLNRIHNVTEFTRSLIPEFTRINTMVYEKFQSRTYQSNSGSLK